MANSWKQPKILLATAAIHEKKKMKLFLFFLKREIQFGDRIEAMLHSHCMG